MSFKYHPNFQEWMRPMVSNGDMCPQCLGESQVKCVGANPDGINLNRAFDCLYCGAKWEGY